jgi:hypothetical protein
MSFAVCPATTSLINFVRACDGEGNVVVVVVVDVDVVVDDVVVVGGG